MEQSFCLGVLTLVADKVVTIWHFDDSDIPTRIVFKKAHIDSVDRISKNGIKQKGFFDGACATVRIPMKEEIKVTPGDYLYIGEFASDDVPVEGALKITEVKDNRRGGQKHWRIVCGG